MPRTPVRRRLRAVLTAVVVVTTAVTAALEPKNPPYRGD